MIDGALLLDKPLGVTSNRALQEARKLYRAKKAGHAGTLDPLASGLLLVLFGEATKFAGPLLDDDKEYLATLKLGERTSTGDAEGEVLERSSQAVSEAAIEAVLERFRGELQQVPPMHSALKRDGVPLYALARKGQTVERAARRVRISALEKLAFEPPRLELRVRCSKGTYIRTLAEDIGAALGTCAHLAALRRTGSGRFSVRDAVGLEALAATPEGERARHLLALPDLLAGLPRAELDAEQEARFRNGQALKGFSSDGLCAVYGARGAVIGLGQADGAGALRPLRLVAASQTADKHRQTL
ncbi:MAG: tRNA pseudouridine(55) synthase TruB [Betaproteobacteria bacterium RIFCSPLOWO2_12_FULL_65_14]|nr:MAG: tRNA pseudouridine(55) synthase TruB [Betaproteobacteria bacterium RIFCSPLOWO2_12_FULL_65_14]